MQVHFLKIDTEYAVAKLMGIKNFEIRSNDRNFKVGDYIRYTVVSKTKKLEKTKMEQIQRYFDDRVYQIVYITNFNQKEGYIVFGEKMRYIYE